MKNLRLLNKKFLLIVISFLFFGFATQSQEPVDIWNVEVKSTNEDDILINSQDEDSTPLNSIYEMQSQKK